MRIVILPVLAGLLTSSALCAPPPAMTDLPYAQAIKQNAEQDDKLLIVKFTADWCVPCKRMDRTVWSDAKVIEYLQEHGITVIAVDIDA
jgi:thiol:disulfide interchange protein